MANDFAAITRLLVDTSARAFLLAALAAIVLRFWRPRDANFQHRAWTAVLWGMLLLPILAPLTPALSLLPSGWRWESGPVIAQSIAQSSLAPKKTILAEPEFLDNAAPRAKTDEPSQAIVPDESATSSISTQDIARDSIVIHHGERQPVAMPQTSALGWPGVISILYLLGMVLLFARLAIGCLAVGRLVRRATDIPRPLGCRGRVATSDAVRVPVSVWLQKPVILLPADWHHWSDALLSSVVMHEQAHIDRRDHLVLLVSELNRCLYWFHPVAWFLRRRLSALAEQCCDDTVIAALQSRGDYARHLLEIASRLMTDPCRVALLGISMARSSQVESRIIAILDERRPLAGRIGRGGALALAAIVGPIVLLAAGLRAADPPPQKKPAAAAKEAVAPAAEATPQKTPTARNEAAKPPVKGMPVSGRVVLASDGSPAAGAEIQLLLTKPDWHRLDARRAKTDEQGNFAFEDVPPGSHWLVAVSDGLASRRERQNAKVVKIAADHAPEPVLLKLSPAPSIAVRVTSKADGTPVAGAQVWLLDHQWDEETDAQGRVLLRGLTPEQWRVRIHAQGFAEQMIPIKLEGDQRAELNFALEPGGKIHGTAKDKSGHPLPNVDMNLSFAGERSAWFDGTQTDAEGRYHFEFVPLGEKLDVDASGEPYIRARQKVTVPAGGNRDLEVDLVVERRPVGGSIQGVVTDQDGKPIVGASLTNRGNRSRDVHETYTVGAGRFTLDDVYSDSGGTFVVFRAKGFAPQAVSVTPGPADEPTEIAVKLKPGHRIRGRVLDAAGKPIQWVWVFYEGGGYITADSIGGYARTGAEGRFEFDSLPADCPFSFHVEGYAPLQDQMLALYGDEEVTVTLPPQGIVRGRVVDATTGAPIKVFRVRIKHSPDRQPDDPQGGINGSQREGVQFEAADGRFLFDDLMVGLPLQVSVETDDFGTTTLRRVLPRPASDAEIVEFKIGPTDPAMIGTVSGVIVDEEGRPKPGAQLRLIVAESDPEPQRLIRFQWGQVRDGRVAERDGVVQFLSTTTDRQGAFHFDHVRTDHEIELWCWGEGISDDRVVHLEAFTDGQRQHLRIENPTPGAIEGKINRDTFPDVNRIDAVHQGAGDGYHVDFQNQPQKEDYQLRNLPPGKYLLQVRKPLAPGEDFRPLRDGKFVIVEPGKTTKLDLGF